MIKILPLIIIFQIGCASQGNKPDFVQKDQAKKHEYLTGSGPSRNDKEIDVESKPNKPWYQVLFGL